MIKISTAQANIEIDLLGEMKSVRVDLDTRESTLVIEDGVAVGLLQNDRVFRRIGRAEAEASRKLKVLHDRIQSGKEEVYSDDYETLSYIDDLNMNSMLKTHKDIQLMSIINAMDDIIYNNVIRQMQDKKVLKALDKAIVKQNNRILSIPMSVRLKTGDPLSVSRCSTLLTELEKIEMGEETDIRLSKKEDVEHNKILQACVNLISNYIETNITGKEVCECSVKERFLVNIRNAKQVLLLSVCKAVERYLSGECVGQIGDKMILKVAKPIKLEELRINIRFVGSSEYYTLKIKVV